MKYYFSINFNAKQIFYRFLINKKYNKVQPRYTTFEKEKKMTMSNKIVRVHECLISLNI